MPKYRYTAVNDKGRTVRGVMAAKDETDLYEKLKSKENYLISAREAAERKSVRPLKMQTLSDFCRELGTLLSAGVSLVRALSMISRNESMNPNVRAVYAGLLRQIRQGVALSDAMESMGNIFPPMMVGMFRAAEAAGNMDTTAIRLSEYYAGQHRLNARVKSSMTYPKFLGFLTAAVMAFLLGFVLPQFEPLFGMTDELPLPTRILFAVTGFLGGYWYVLIFLAAAGAAAFCAVRRIAAVRLMLDKIKIHMPIMGTVWKMIYTSRFSACLSALYGAGIPIVTALQISKGSIGNAWIEKQLETSAAVIRAGGTLSDAIEPIDGFVRKLAFSIRVGEETGSLDTMLGTAAEEFGYESELAVNRMVSCLEPMMIIVMGLFVGFIMVAVMMPIYASYSAIESSAYN